MNRFQFLLLAAVFLAVPAEAEEPVVTEVYHLPFLEHRALIPVEERQKASDSGSGVADDPFEDSLVPLDPFAPRPDRVEFRIPEPAQDLFRSEYDSSVVDIRDRFEKADLNFASGDLVYFDGRLFARGSPEQIRSLTDFIDSCEVEPTPPMVELKLLLRTPSGDSQVHTALVRPGHDYRLDWRGHYRLVFNVDEANGATDSLELFLDYMVPGTCEFSIQDVIELDETSVYHSDGDDAHRIEIKAARSWGDPEGIRSIENSYEAEFAEKKAQWAAIGPSLKFEPKTDEEIAAERARAEPVLETLVMRLPPFYFDDWQTRGAPRPTDPFADSEVIAEEELAEFLSPGKFRPTFGPGNLIDVRWRCEAISLKFRPGDFAIYNLQSHKLFARAAPDTIELIAATLPGFHCGTDDRFPLKVSLVELDAEGQSKVRWEQGADVPSGRPFRSSSRFPGGPSSSIEVEPVRAPDGYTLEVSYRVNVESSDIEFSVESSLAIFDGSRITVPLEDKWALRVEAVRWPIYRRHPYDFWFPNLLDDPFHERSAEIQFPFPESNTVDFITVVEPSPRESLLRAVIGNAVSSDDLDFFHAVREASEDFESLQVAPEGHYDLRPLLEKCGLQMPEGLTALWFPFSEQSVFQLPSSRAGEFPDTLLDLQESDGGFPGFTISGALISLASDSSLHPASRPMEFEDLVRYDGPIEVLDRFEVLTPTEDPVTWDSPPDQPSKTRFHCQTGGAADNPTVDLTFEYRFEDRIEGASFEVNSDYWMATSRPRVLELAGQRRGQDLERVFLVLQVDRMSRLGSVLRSTAR